MWRVPHWLGIWPETIRCAPARPVYTREWNGATDGTVNTTAVGTFVVEGANRV